MAQMKTDLVVQVLNWFTPQPPMRRYRVTPRRNPAAFRREVLAAIIHNLKRDSTRATHG